MNVLLIVAMVLSIVSLIGGVVSLVIVASEYL